MGFTGSQFVWFSAIKGFFFFWEKPFGAEEIIFRRVDPFDCYFNSLGLYNSLMFFAYCFPILYTLSTSALLYTLSTSAPFPPQGAGSSKLTALAVFVPRFNGTNCTLHWCICYNKKSLFLWCCYVCCFASSDIGSCFTNLNVLFCSFLILLSFFPCKSMLAT